MNGGTTEARRRPVTDLEPTGEVLKETLKRIERILSELEDHDKIDRIDRGGSGLPPWRRTHHGRLGV